MNSYDSLVKTNFFQSIDIIEGKSIGDIAINDYQDVQYACELFKDGKMKGSSQTAFHHIIQDDSYREKMLLSIDFNEEALLVDHDFYFRGTFERAIKLGAT